MKTLEELNRRECNGHLKLRMGNAVASPYRFRKIFRKFSEGTYFEQMDLEIEEVAASLSCSECGYKRRIESDSYVYSFSCPRCREELSLKEGQEFEIVEPTPQ